MQFPKKQPVTKILPAGNKKTSSPGISQSRPVGTLKSQQPGVSQLHSGVSKYQTVTTCVANSFTILPESKPLPLPKKPARKIKPKKKTNPKKNKTDLTQAEIDQIVEQAKPKLQPIIAKPAPIINTFPTLADRSAEGIYGNIPSVQIKPKKPRKAPLKSGVPLAIKNIQLTIKQSKMKTLSVKTAIVPLHNLYLALRYSNLNLPIRQEKIELKSILGTSSISKCGRKLNKFCSTLSGKQWDSIEKQWNRKFGDNDFVPTMEKIGQWLHERKENKKQQRLSNSTTNIPKPKTKKPKKIKIQLPNNVLSILSEDEQIITITEPQEKNEFESDDDIVADLIQTKREQEEKATELDTRQWLPVPPPASPLPTAQQLEQDHYNLYGGYNIEPVDVQEEKFETPQRHNNNLFPTSPCDNPLPSNFYQPIQEPEELNDTVYFSPSPPSPLPCPDPSDDEAHEENYQRAINYIPPRQYRKIPKLKHRNWFRAESKPKDPPPPPPPACATIVQSGDDSLNEIARKQHRRPWRFLNRNTSTKWIRKGSNIEVYHPVSPQSEKPPEELTLAKLNTILQNQPNFDLIGGRVPRIRMARRPVPGSRRDRREQIRQRDQIATNTTYMPLITTAQNLNIPPLSQAIHRIEADTVHVTQANQFTSISFTFDWTTGAQHLVQPSHGIAAPDNPYRQFQAQSRDIEQFVTTLLNSGIHLYPQTIRSWRFRVHLQPRNEWDYSIGDIIVSTKWRVSKQGAIDELMRKIREKFEKYEEEDYEIAFWNVSVVPENQLQIQGAAMNQESLSIHIKEKLNEIETKWFIINPNSKTNCLWTSVAICTGYLNNPKLLFNRKVQNEAGRNIKRKVKVDAVRAGNETDIQTIATYKNCIINVWDIHNTIIKTFTSTKTDPEPTETYNIFIDSGHFHALVPKDCEVAKEHYAKAKPVVPIPTLIKKLDKEFKGRLIVAYDIESYRLPLTEDEKQIQQIAYAISWAFKCETEDIATEAEQLGYTITRYNWEHDEKNTEEMIVAYKEEIGNPETGEWESNCLDRAIDQWLSHPFFHRAVFYAHNGGKFDIRLIMGQSLMMWDEDYYIDGDKTIELNSRIINLEICNKREERIEQQNRGGNWIDVTVPQTIQIKDSFPLFGPGSSLAKLGKELHTHHRKLEEKINVHALQYPDTWYGNWQRYDMATYLRHDVFTLLEVLLWFDTIVYKETSIPITCVNTGASLAKKYYLSKYYLQDEHKPEEEVYTLTKEFDEFIRQSYGGGRCESFWHGLYDGPCYYYDFTSLYPDVGRNPVPTGKPTWLVPPIELDNYTNYVKRRWQSRVIEKDFELDSEEVYFWKVKVTSPLAQAGTPMNSDITKPLFGIKQDGMYVFRWFSEATEMILYEPEIMFAIEKGLDYSFEPINAVKFRKAPILADIMDTLFKKKQAADREGNKGLAKTWKIIVNSLYGVWGLKTLGREGIQIARPEMSTWAVDLAQEKLMDIERIGNYIVTRREHDLEVKDCNVAIASAVTSYARMKLYSLFLDITRKGGQLLYCDTDSVITTKHIEGDEELKNKWMLDSNGQTLGKDLGKLKNEIVDCYEKYPNLQPQDNFARCVIVAPKLYYIEGVDSKIAKKAHKGYQENKDNNDLVSFQRMFALVDPDREEKDRKLEQTTVQWIGGNAGFIAGDIGVKNIERDKVLRPGVRKGNLNGKKVIPFASNTELKQRQEALKEYKKRMKEQ